MVLSCTVRLSVSSVAAILLGIAVCPWTAGAQTLEQVDFFEKRVRPVLANNCYGCHSLQVPQPFSGLRLDSREALLQGGNRGPAVVPGDPSRSRLIQAVRHQTLMMPPNGELAETEIADLEQWVGSENQNLPGFIALCPGGSPTGGAPNWRSAFLPGAYQGTFIDTSEVEVERLIANIKNRSVSPEGQRRQLDLLAELNRDHQQNRGEDALLEARIQSFELAYRMQMEASDVFDISREPESVKRAYGDTVHGRQMIITRRLLGKGARFVQVYHGAGQPWDSHNEIAKNHGNLGKECDQPIGAFLKDLKQRGMLDDTLVIWGGEFGRTPAVELTAFGSNPGVNGRDHNSYGFSMWLAGGGVKGGFVHGSTDEFGFRAVDKPVHVHDLHATILHLLGFDHEKFTYRYLVRRSRVPSIPSRSDRSSAQRIVPMPYPAGSNDTCA